MDLRRTASVHRCHVVNAVVLMPIEGAKTLDQFGEPPAPGPVEREARVPDCVHLEKDDVTTRGDDILRLEQIAGHEDLTSTNARVDPQVGEEAVRSGNAREQARLVPLRCCNWEGSSRGTHEVSRMAVKDPDHPPAVPDLGEHELSHLHIRERTILAVSVVLVKVDRIAPSPLLRSQRRARWGRDHL